ncbi:thioredoxin family protein [Cytobacillus sp. IB215665]|uniref:thioredoxin family protein n=1 Tax=Cytobacillus sp. IB215665 TaxID=3097357 RepID=UPI002A11B5DA|nr:thioredoxin family protein [Cytobacillus sp. IB215665]MDX8365963.1 thioredoxin family protein [Cytobacillus sp. IB215665]
MQQWTDQINKVLQASGLKGVYFYTPLCGTCQLAERMLGVVKEIVPLIEFGKVDVNYVPDLAERYEIQSVPCLLIFKNNMVIKRIYAFQSVDVLYKHLKDLD